MRSNRTVIEVMAVAVALAAVSLTVTPAQNSATALTTNSPDAPVG